MPFWGLYRSKDYLPKAKEAALKALELNKDLAQAYASLGNILFSEYDWDGAERKYKKAIELDPKYANAYKWYGDLLSTKGMFEEGLQQYDKALELDPFNLSTLDTKARTLGAAERLDEAIRQSKKIIELFPEQGFTHFFLSSIYRKKEMEREAIEQWMIGLEKIGTTPEEIRLREQIYGKRGFAGLTRARLERRLASIRSRLEKDKNAVIKYVDLAKDYGDLKDKEKTLEFLNKAYENRDPNLTELKRSQSFRFLKDDPAFQELVKKIGFPETVDR
jgi:tetratricopeptide (TPR) repeat protein